MPIYLVDRDLPHTTIEGLRAMQQAAERASEQVCTAHTPVRYPRSVFIPGEARCMCLFEAADETIVTAVNEAAELLYTRIVAALDLDPQLRR